MRGAERCRHVGVTRGTGAPATTVSYAATSDRNADTLAISALPSCDGPFGPGLTESTGSSIGAFTVPGG